MADRRSKTVAGRNFPSVCKDDRYVLAAGATVTPGMVLEVVGKTPQGQLEVQPHSTDGGPVARTMLALERSHPPRGDQTRTLRKDQDYTDEGEMVEVAHFRPGDSSDNLLLATGNDIAPGDALASNGDGSLRAYVPSTETSPDDPAAIVASADEALNNTSGSNSRIGGTF